jgi:hypothetical protein
LLRRVKRHHFLTVSSSIPLFQLHSCLPVRTFMKITRLTWQLAKTLFCPGVFVRYFAHIGFGGKESSFW